MERFSKRFYHPEGVKETPKNLERVLVGDSFITRETEGKPQEGLVYSDFGVQSLLDAGATDLLQGRPTLAGNTFSDYDTIANVENSGILDQLETKESKETKENND